MESVNTVKQKAISTLEAALAASVLSTEAFLRFSPSGRVPRSAEVKAMTNDEKVALAEHFAEFEELDEAYCAAFEGFLALEDALSESISVAEWDAEIVPLLLAVSRSRPDYAKRGFTEGDLLILGERSN